MVATPAHTIFGMDCLGSLGAHRDNKVGGQFQCFKCEQFWPGEASLHCDGCDYDFCSGCALKWEYCRICKPEEDRRRPKKNRPKLLRWSRLPRLPKKRQSDCFWCFQVFFCPIGGVLRSDGDEILFFVEFFSALVFPLLCLVLRTCTIMYPLYLNTRLGGPLRGVPFPC